jgi:hypothetical protein
MRAVLDYFDSHGLAGKQFGDPNCPGNAIVDHQLTICSPRHLQGGHSLTRCPVLHRLPLQLHGVSPGRSLRWKTQRGRVNIKKFSPSGRGHTTPILQVKSFQRIGSLILFDGKRSSIRRTLRREAFASKCWLSCGNRGCQSHRDRDPADLECADGSDLPRGATWTAVCSGLAPSCRRRGTV